MKLHVVYDADGTSDLNIEGYKISTQLFKRGKSGLVKVYNEDGKKTHVYHFGKVYSMKSEL